MKEIREKAKSKMEKSINVLLTEFSEIMSRKS